MQEATAAPPAGGHNLFPYEPQARVLAALALSGGVGGYSVGEALGTSGWVMAAAAAAMAVYLAVTAVHRHCPMYAALGINAEHARRSHYMALLPEHNPAPVLAFAADGAVQFRNHPAEQHFGAVDHLNEILREAAPNSRKVVEQGAAFTETLEVGSRTYQMRVRGIPEAASLLVYAFDITRVVSLEREMITTQEEIIHRMGEIGETRSEEVGNHVRRVALYSRMLAELAGADQETARLLEMASPMHDIGKVGIPDRVLNKPGRLDDAEWAVMKGHAKIGYELLCRSRQPILQAAATVAHQHHEKWNGTGYPQGLAGADIHLFGRITALADVFDALGSERVYKPAWALEAILDLLRRERGHHFDPALVDAFLDNLDHFLAVRDQNADPVDSLANITPEGHHDIPKVTYSSS